MAEPAKNPFQDPATYQMINEGAMTWYALITGKQVPAIRESIAERVTGRPLDSWSLIAIAGFVGLGLWLVSRR